MVTCNRCGAELSLDLLECPYCRTLTAHGFARREAEAAAQRAAGEAARAHEQAFAHAQRLEAERSLRRSSQHAVLWSLGGLLLCCSPLALVGLVLGFRSRALARRVGLVLPMTATLGIWLAFVQLLLFGAMIAYTVYEHVRVSTRLDELTLQIGRKAEAAELEQATACALAERFLLTHGFGDSSEISIEDIRCDGALEQTGSRAELRAVEFTAGSEKVRGSACLSRGARWSVERIQKNGCATPEPEKAPNAAPSQSSSAPASSGK